MLIAHPAILVARGTAAKPIARVLSPNQRACFTAACKELGARDALLERLGLPAAPAVPAENRSWFRRLFG